jgi:hypothetical protein
MTGGERVAIERAITGAALEQEKELRVAVGILPDHPFRSYEAPELEKILVWSAGLLAKGHYGPNNVDLLLDAMAVTGWPRGWSQFESESYLESLWSPLHYNPDAIADLCAALRDEDEASDALVATRQRFMDSAWVLAAIEEEPVPRPTRPQPAIRGLAL